MVRLKEPLTDLQRFGPNISIPYGSIKRECANISKRKESVISIPYGSIKSFPAAFCFAPVMCISIPYGSIKR